jgi:DNA-binding MurR/RpiR family transcriptional regulator
LKPKDLLIAVGFLRAPRESQTAMDYAKKVGATALQVPDLATSPIAKKADLYLFAQLGFYTTVKSTTAPFSLVNALLLAVAGAKKSESLKALKILDQWLESYPV